MSQGLGPMQGTFAAVFTEWLRRYEREPERFGKEYGEPTEYGADCARYFLKLLDEHAAGTLSAHEVSQ